MKLTELSTVNNPTSIHQLSQNQLRELQIALARLGYPVGDIDGLIGPKTRNAWAEFKTDVFLGNPDLIGVESIQALESKLNAFPSEAALNFANKQAVMDAIKAECKAHDIGLKPQIAYVLATVEWETAQTFKPVREAFWLTEDWRKLNLRYYPYYGRGYVQLTWRNNYEKYSAILGVDLVTEPDNALDPKVALFVLVHGFKTGAFTGRKIGDFISEQQTDFINARRCINGRDRAHDIEKLATKYLGTL
jgi:predicted chitinase